MADEIYCYRCHRTPTYKVCLYNYFNWKYVCPTHLSMIVRELLSGEWETYDVQVRRYVAPKE